MKLNQVLARDPRSQVYVLGIPRRPPNAPTMFASPQMARLVSTLRRGADFIVIDCGVAMPALETAPLAQLADATVLVARRPMLHSPVVANAARILQGARTAPIGIVVTR
jgi:Mrp family chromosome partitioning ATPase